MDFENILKNIAKTARDIWDRGWAEANGGNISLRLNEQQFSLLNLLKPKTDWIEIESPVPSLAQERFMVTATGSYLRNIELFPDRNVGFVELDDKGKNYRILWGCELNGRPTSEFSAHLLSHAAIKAKTNNRDHAVIHTHTPNLIALTYCCQDIDTVSLTKLLWRMHAECVVVFPDGVEFIPWMMAGSLEIGLATAEALAKRPLAVWEYHGVFGTGRNLDEAFGRIYVAEKAAEIYLKVLSAGGIKKILKDDQILKIAENFKCKLDKNYFNIK